MPTMPLKNLQKKILSRLGLLYGFQAAYWDLRRLIVRLGYFRFSEKKFLSGTSNKLHLGCGSRKLAGWLNVDLLGSDFNVDLAKMPLPFPDNSFEVIVSQQVIEHLRLEAEMIPLLHELFRILRPGGSLWISCPDMEKICSSYVQDKGMALLEDRLKRYPDFKWNPSMPSQHMVNVYFHQEGEHKNLFDFQMLSLELSSAGFVGINRASEDMLLNQFKDIPLRNDDFHSVYVLARKFV